MGIPYRYPRPEIGIVVNGVRTTDFKTGEMPTMFCGNGYSPHW